MEPFAYEELFARYRSILMENIDDARKKALLMRPMLEACVAKLVNKSNIYAENIGGVYKRATGNPDEKIREYAIKLQELYKITCKYHHGAEEGSQIGIAWVNSEEVEYMDEELLEVIDYIDSCDAVLRSS